MNFAKFCINTYFVEHLVFLDSAWLPTTSLDWHLKQSLRRCFIERSVLYYFAKFRDFTKLQLCQVLFSNKDVGWGAAVLLKEDYSTSVFLEFCKIIKITIFLEHLWTSVSGKSPIAKLLEATVCPQLLSRFKYFTKQFHLRCLTDFWNASFLMVRKCFKLLNLGIKMSFSP